MKRLLIVLLLLGMSFAETTCSVQDCEITITLKIAFSGADDNYINNAENEIESVWNGPNGYRTTGDCSCRITFDVITNKTADCKNNPPQGWHCIMVTDYNNNPPRNQTNWTGAKFYIGYMYNVTTGNGNNSGQGWWSNIMSRPVNASEPNGEHYQDFAHEAGHMMGLEDGDGGIMSRTSGPNSGPTQANIDEIANDICGANACPDRCCCGNGAVDKGKGEQCDPFASPVGCKAGEACCPVCCSCYAPICIPANGEYLSQADCQNACGAGSTCYKNYKSGCWDCVLNIIKVEETCYDPENIWGNLDCDHAIVSFGQYVGSISGVLSDERINIKTDGGDTGNIITADGEVEDYGLDLLDDPSVTILTDRETVSLIASGHMSVQQAMAADRIRMQGEGLVNGFRFWAYELSFDIYNMFSPVPEAEIPDMDYGLPPEYQEVVQQPLEVPADDPMKNDIGELPDLGLGEHEQG